MDRELLVTLIRKHIDELIMLTEGFMEMESYPEAIINLAKSKTDDIWSYINQLGALQPVAKQAVEAVKEVDKDQFEDEEDALTDDLWDDEIVDEVPLFPDEEDDDINFEQAIEEAAEEFEAVADDIVEPVFEELEELVEAEVETESEASIVIEEMIEDLQVEHEAEEPVLQEKKTTLAEKINIAGATRNEALTNGEKADLHASLSNQKIDDIRQAISLGDRFRFQRELFRNNGEEMNKTLSYINSLATYEEIVSFLQSKYTWDEENATVADFYKIVQRKF